MEQRIEDMSRTTSACLFVLAALPSAKAGEGWETQPYGIPGHLSLGNQPVYQGYTASTKALTPPSAHAFPECYNVTITLLPSKPPAGDSNIVVLMARLPEHAQLWVNNRLTLTQGMVRYFESPPLTPGKHYFYTVRVIWHENGKWVQKTENVPVHAGAIRCVYLTLSEVADNLAKLGALDRQLAEVQKVCPISNDPLGSLGVPIRIVLRGQPVFLCCEDCIAQAQAEPARTLAKVKELKDSTKGP